MYKVKVLKRGKVIIGDLNLVLKQGDVVDLDERFPREQLDASANLRKATSGDDPLIAILHKDVVVERTDLSALAAMEARLKQTIFDHLAQNRPQAQAGTDPAMAAMMAQMLEVLKNQPGQTTQAQKSGSIDSPIDDDKLVDIHTRAVQRLTKDTEGSVASEAKTVQSDAAKRAKDLEDMF